MPNRRVLNCPVVRFASQVSAKAKEGMSGVLSVHLDDTGFVALKLFDGSEV